MTLNTVHCEGSTEASTATVLDHITAVFGTRGLADNTPCYFFIARLEGVDNAGCTVNERAFFVAGDQQRYTALVVRMFGDEAFNSHHHGGKATFHVRGAAPIKHAVNVGGFERRCV